MASSLKSLPTPSDEEEEALAKGEENAGRTGAHLKELPVLRMRTSGAAGSARTAWLVTQRTLCPALVRADINE